MRSHHCGQGREGHLAPDVRQSLAAVCQCEWWKTEEPWTFGVSSCRSAHLWTLRLPGPPLSTQSLSLLRNWLPVRWGRTLEAGEGELPCFSGRKIFKSCSSISTSLGQTVGLKFWSICCVWIAICKLPFKGASPERQLPWAKMWVREPFLLEPQIACRWDFLKEQAYIRYMYV